MFSVLQNIQNIKFNSTPYPYLVIDDALPTDYMSNLKRNSLTLIKLLRMIEP